jgi:hypothetical protein
VLAEGRKRNVKCNCRYLGPRLGIDLPHRLGCHRGRQLVGRGLCWIERIEEWSRVLAGARRVVEVAPDVRRASRNGKLD